MFGEIEDIEIGLDIDGADVIARMRCNIVSTLIEQTLDFYSS